MAVDANLLQRPTPVGPELCSDNVWTKHNNLNTFIYYLSMESPCLANVVPVIHAAQVASAMDAAEEKTEFSPSVASFRPAPSRHVLFANERGRLCLSVSRRASLVAQERSDLGGAVLKQGPSLWRKEVASIHGLDGATIRVEDLRKLRQF